MLSLALAAELAEDWEELWKDDPGNMDARGALQLSVKENINNVYSI